MEFAGGGRTRRWQLRPPAATGGRMTATRTPSSCACTRGRTRSTRRGSGSGHQLTFPAEKGRPTGCLVDTGWERLSSRAPSAPPPTSTRDALYALERKDSSYERQAPPRSAIFCAVCTLLALEERRGVGRSRWFRQVNRQEYLKGLRPLRV